MVKVWGEKMVKNKEIMTDLFFHVCDESIEQEPRLYSEEHFRLKKIFCR